MEHRASAARIVAVRRARPRRRAERLDARGPRPSGGRGACASRRSRTGRSAGPRPGRSSAPPRATRASSGPWSSARIRSGGTPCAIAQSRATSASVVRSSGSLPPVTMNQSAQPWSQSATACSSRASKTSLGRPLNCAAPSTTIASTARRSSSLPRSLIWTAMYADQRDRADQGGHAAEHGPEHWAEVTIGAERRVSARGTSCTSARSRTSTRRCGRSSRRSAYGPAAPAGPRRSPPAAPAAPTRGDPGRAGDARTRRRANALARGRAAARARRRRPARRRAPAGPAPASGRRRPACGRAAASGSWTRKIVLATWCRMNPDSSS